MEATMTTVLGRFTEAYATLTFAVYEPLIVRWFSRLGMDSLADQYVKCAVSTQVGRASARFTTPRTLGNSLQRSRPLQQAITRLEGNTFITARTTGFDDLRLLASRPQMEITGETTYFGGRIDNPFRKPSVDASGGKVSFPVDAPTRIAAPPLVFSSSSQIKAVQFDTAKATADIATAYNVILVKWLKANPGKEPSSSFLADLITKVAAGVLAGQAMKVEKPLFEPSGTWLEFMSPIGIAHFYRQLYFYLSEGVGPVEQALTIAPKETLEVVTETVRRQSHEEVYEHGSETVSEKAVESRNVDEVSDKVASMVQRDTSVAISANSGFEASGGIPVFNYGASISMGLNTTIAQSSQNSSELAKKQLKEVTKRASERITKTFSLRVRDTVDFTTTNVQRRVIKNESNKPVSYGLRRVYSRVQIKVQNLGPNLVWQLYISSPGAGLAGSRFVHFAPGQPIAPPGEPPALRPKPVGGIQSGTVTTGILMENTLPVTDPMRFYVTIAIQVPPDQTIVAVSIEAIEDLEHLGKTDYVPAPSGASKPGSLSNGVYTVDLGVWPGDSSSVSVRYQYRFDPSLAVIALWEEERKKAHELFQAQQAAEREKALREQFERQKSVITELSRIRPRPSADLREEERYEVFNRMISHLFKPRGTGSPGAPAPFEIELFHRYFDVEAMFVFLHPSWWVPRYAGVASGFGRSEYEITTESEPARLGSSIGWMIQLDGDNRRNEFINSPWVRVCLPFRKGRERDAVVWLAKHVEGQAGYDINADPLKSVVAELEKVRANEKSVVGVGPDYVDANTVIAAVTGAPGAPLKPESVYPVIDQFDVTVPTEGFVYDDLVVKIP
jgi:hypothetical protein